MSDNEKVLTCKWISVKDTLPNLKDESKIHNSVSPDVLVVESDEQMYVAYLSFYAIAGYRKKEVYRWSEISTGCGRCGRNLNPTHWMPLPELPKDS